MSLTSADFTTQVSFEDGSYVIRQGEEGRDFFVISSGEVSCTVKKNPANAEEQAKEVGGRNIFVGTNWNKEVVGGARQTVSCRERRVVVHRQEEPRRRGGAGQGIEEE